MEGRILPTNRPSSYQSRFDVGLDGIKVRLLNPPDPYLAAETIAVFAETTFGDIKGEVDYRGTVGGSQEAWSLAQGAAEFKHVIPNALETVVLTFSMDGLSRATTHQLVRTRVGAVFGQFSQRANNVSQFNMRVPQILEERMPPGALRRYQESITHLNRFYESAIKHGVPFQDARYVIPEGVETSLTASYNLLSLISTIKRRICNRMQWEVNYVARLMADQVVEALPWVGKALRSGCESRGVCQTTDPMFEPSCLHWDKRAEQVKYCEDSPALKEMMGDLSHNWGNESNGCVRHFHVTDLLRLEEEGPDPDKVMSMSSTAGTRALVKKDSNGLWRKA